MSKKPTNKRADKYKDKVKVKGSYSELMKELFPKVKSKKDAILPKIAPKKK